MNDHSRSVTKERTKKFLNFLLSGGFDILLGTNELLAAKNSWRSHHVTHMCLGSAVFFTTYNEVKSTHMIGSSFCLYFYLYGRGLNKYLKKPDTINQRLCLSLNLSANTKKYPFTIFGRLQRRVPFVEFMRERLQVLQVKVVFSFYFQTFRIKHLQ